MRLLSSGCEPERPEMFRNPRENAHPSTKTPLKPSAGRPPTPPDGVQTPQPQSTMAKSEPTKPLTPRPNSKSNVPILGRQGTKKPFSARTPAKTNSSILNFFKKVDSPLKDDSIFMSQRPEANVPARPRSQSPDLLNTVFEEIYDNNESVDSGRFNESVASVKRQKTSHGGTPDEPGEENGDISSQKLVATLRVEKAGSPPPRDRTTKINPCKPRRRGPFLSDSDTDDESDSELIQRTAVTAEKQRHAIVSNQVELDQLADANLTHQEESHESKSTVHFTESIEDMQEKSCRRVPVAKAQAQWEALQPKQNAIQDEKDDGSSYSDEEEVSRHFLKKPASKKEDTSVDEWENFEGIDELVHDDDLADGEEFIERKFMEEQARIEEAEQEEDEEPFNGFDGKPLASPDDAVTAACPICEASLVGINPDDASRHVNGCLDGKSIPLSSTVKDEPKAKIMAPEGKNRFIRKAAIARPGQANPFELGSTTAAPLSAFSKLMSGKVEDAAWASAAASEHSSRGKPAYQRTCPFYKIMPGFSICVDAFRYGAVQGCNAYFLSHFHSDHYIGLTASWCHGPIYCSKVTANLVKQQLRVNPKYVIPLDFESRFEIPETQGVAITMIPANHCPGSSLFLFEKAVRRGANPKVQRVLHCGDFRACPAHISHPLLMPDIVDSITGKTKQQKIDVCYLDTTYLNPRYSFPSQEEVIKACADMCVSLKKERAEENDAWEIMKRERAGAGMKRFVDSSIRLQDDSIAMSISSKTDKPRGRLLVVCGTYSIGKERICMGIARALDCKIWCPPGKMRICKALEDPELMSRLTDDPEEAQIHMQMLMEIRAETLQEYLNSYKPHFTRIVGFRPSGWNYKPPNSRFTESPSVDTVLHSTNWKSSFSMSELVPQRGSTREASCFGVPYSEHSSFRELTMFVCTLRIEKVVPTVNVGTATARAKMKTWIERWMAERRKNGVVKIGDEEGHVRW